MMHMMHAIHHVQMYLFCFLSKVSHAMGFVFFFSGSHPEVFLLLRKHLVFSRDIEVREEGWLVKSER